jgi:hypothetical protein
MKKNLDILKTKQETYSNVLPPRFNTWFDYYCDLKIHLDSNPDATDFQYLYNNIRYKASIYFVKSIAFDELIDKLKNFDNMEYYPDEQPYYLRLLLDSILKPTKN